MKISKLIATVAMATVLGAGAASAATFGTIPGGTATNEGLAPLGLENPLSGWYGSSIWLNGTGSLTVEATLMGAEAGFTNKFTMGSDVNNTLTDAGDSVPGGHFDSNGVLAVEGYKSISTTTTAGLLDFSFLAGPGASVTNGSNPDNTLPTPFPGVNFFASYGNGTTEQSVFDGVVWLFFDDDGASNDDNHDDLIIKLTVTSGGGGIGILPVPAAGFLLFGALGGLAALGRRKKKAA